MAGITLAQRDLSETRDQLRNWFANRFDSHDVVLSELTNANRAAGWSSETLVFSVHDPSSEQAEPNEFVIRIPPAGGGMFPVYDLEGQTLTQELLHRHGVKTPAPSFYEPDATWIGSRFMVMPRIIGHTPSDTSYATRGWLHGAGAEVQRRLHNSFLDTLATLHRVPIADATWLHRAAGVGVGPEIFWWKGYLGWVAGDDIPDLMVDAFAWLERHQPADPGPLSFSWGDARLSNTIFDDTGAIIGVIDWEQACICPAEADFGWWLATRRQTMEVAGITADPELPGFDSRERVIGRYEEMIGRSLNDLPFYEMFSMIRMACCILRTQALMRSIGLTGHGFLRAPILPNWAVQTIRDSPRVIR